MPEFLRGGKRGAGIATLMIAIAFLVGWLRSLQTDDYMYCCPTRANYILVSSQGLFTLMSYSYASHSVALSRSDALFKPTVKNLGLGWVTTSIFNGPTIVLWQTATKAWHSEYGGFSIGTASFSKNEKVICVSFPYWSIVLPLTGISAALLLTRSKPSGVPKLPPLAAN